MTALLLLTLLSAEPELVSEAPETVDEWAGEGARRVHYGVGARVHAGVLTTLGYPALVFQSEAVGFINIRVFGHHEWRIGIGLAVGYPDVFAAESNVGFRFNLSPRFSVGVGTLAFWGMSSLRAGLEVPFAVRLGSNRRHEISLTLRGTAGVFNGSTLVWWDFAKQHFAIAGDVVAGYSAVF